MGEGRGVRKGRGWRGGNKNKKKRGETHNKQSLKRNRQYSSYTSERVAFFIDGEFRGVWDEVWMEGKDERGDRKGGGTANVKDQKRGSENQQKKRRELPPKTILPLRNPTACLSRVGREMPTIFRKCVCGGMGGGR